MANLIERHRDRIRGVLSWFDRVVIKGTLPSVCHAGAMATMLDSRDIRIFDYFARFAQPFRESIRAHAERLAAEEGVEVEYIKKPKGFRKEDRIREIVARRGTHPGHIDRGDAIGPVADLPDKGCRDRSGRIRRRGSCAAR
jgi:hypothetical protein